MEQPAERCQLHAFLLKGAVGEEEWHVEKSLYPAVQLNVPEERPIRLLADGYGDAAVLKTVFLADGKNTVIMALRADLEREAVKGWLAGGGSAVWANAAEPESQYGDRPNGS